MIEAKTMQMKTLIAQIVENYTHYQRRLDHVFIAQKLRAWIMYDLHTWKIEVLWLCL